MRDALEEDAGAGGTYISLRNSIRTNNGIIHPIIVIAQGERYKVIEGNTRLAIYHSFNSNTNIKGNWSEIPCVVYDEIEDKEIDAIRLQSHLVGPREWDAYSKGKYLYFLSQQSYMTAGELVEFCGGNSHQVNRYIQAYSDMEKYYRPEVTDDEFDPTRFSAFVEFQKTNVRNAIHKADHTFHGFARWVKDGLLTPSQTVRNLPAILDDQNAHSIFLVRGAVEAYATLTNAPVLTNLNNYSIEDLCNAVLQRFDGLKLKDFEYYCNNPESEAVLLFQNLKDQLDVYLERIERFAR